MSDCVGLCRSAIGAEAAAAQTVGLSERPRLGTRARLLALQFGMAARQSSPGRAVPFLGGDTGSEAAACPELQGSAAAAAIDELTGEAPELKIQKEGAGPLQRGPYLRRLRPQTLAEQRDAARMYHQMLLEPTVPAIDPRPANLDAHSILSQQTYMECSVAQRPKGSDRWITSGGRKGATEIWITPQQGLLKRYGRVVRAGCEGENLKFTLYALLRRANEDAPPEEGRGPRLWVLYPSSLDGTPGAVPAILGPTDGIGVHSYTSPMSKTGLPAMGITAKFLRVSFSRLAAASPIDLMALP